MTPLPRTRKDHGQSQIHPLYPILPNTVKTNKSSRLRRDVMCRTTTSDDRSARAPFYPSAISTGAAGHGKSQCHADSFDHTITPASGRLSTGTYLRPSTADASCPNSDTSRLHMNTVFTSITRMDVPYSAYRTSSVWTLGLRPRGRLLRRSRNRTLRSTHQSLEKGVLVKTLQAPSGSHGTCSTIYISAGDAASFLYPA